MCGKSGRLLQRRERWQVGRHIGDGIDDKIRAERFGRCTGVPVGHQDDRHAGSTRSANIGAGTITVNYDGYDKHRTVIKDGARVGSDTMLIAPVTIGEGAFTGAGSAISRDVADGALAIERAQQKEIPGYAARREERQRRKREES